jgi:hypothetical protein
VSSLQEISFRREGGLFLRCECGFEILLVPHLNMMTNAIEAHAALHGEWEKDPAKASSEQQRIETALMAKTLKAAAGFTENKRL